jgi:hypothetical protein
MKMLAALVSVVLGGVSFAAEAKVFPSSYIQEQTYFEGNWIGEGSIGDDAVTIKFTARWVPGRQGLLLQGSTRRNEGAAKAVRWTLLSGCDVSTKEMVDCSFSSDGGSSVTRWRVLSASEQAGKETGIQDGKPYTVDCKAVKKGPEHWTYSSTTMDGKPVKIEYRRVPAEKAK